MSELQLIVKRDLYTDTETIGKLYANGKYFSETLEDHVRNDGIKVFGKTAIPHGSYKILVTFSPSFKKPLPLIYNTVMGYKVKDSNGNEWAGVRFHGGNTNLDTEGCILVATSRKVNVVYTAVKSIRNWIFGSKSDDLVKLIDSYGGKATLIIE